MDIRIKGWKSVGLRCPDLDIELEGASADSSSVHIIQMPNGTGKTSTLELIKASLSGDARNWTAGEISEFAQSDAQDEGYFRLDLLVGHDALVFEITFDFVSGRAYYTTTSPLIGGRREGWEPPSDIRRFLHRNFVDLIVFDGEFASGVLDSDSRNAEHAVDALSQLYLFDRAATLAQSEKDRIVKSAGVSANKTTLQTTRKNLEKVEDELKKRKELSRRLEDQISENTKQLESLESRFETEVRKVSGDSEELDKLREKKRHARDDRIDFTRELMELTRVPSKLSRKFSASLAELRGGLNAVQLPPSTTRQFFKELAEQDNCVCGRPIDEIARETILQESGRFLGQEEAGVLNLIKSQIEHIDVAIEPNELRKVRDKLVHAINEYNDTNTDLAELEQTISSPSEDLTALKGEIEKLRMNLSKDTQVFERLQHPAGGVGGDGLHSIPELTQQKKKLEDKLHKLTDTVEIGSRTEILSEILVQSKQLARDRLRAQLKDLANTRLSEILKQSPLQIESIGSYVKLQGQKDASVGQKLAVGYVVMANLLQRGAHSLPFIVDSPANPIDHTVRKEIAKLIPQVCDQFITFVISSEKHSFTSTLDANAKQCQFITIFRNVAGTAAYESKLAGHQVGTTDRFTMVKGKKFFDEFDMDEES